MTLKKLMEMLEAHYNGNSDEITVQIGDAGGKGRPITNIDYNKDENLLTIF